MDLQNRKLRKIIELESELTTIADLDLLLERILLETRRAVNADAGSIYIKEGDKLAIKYSQNDTKQKELPEGEKLIYSIFSIDINQNTISGYTAATGEIVNIPDVYSIPDAAPYSYDTQFDEIAGYRCVSMLAIPLKASDGGVLGVIQIINAKNASGEIVSFSEEDELFVRHFAHNASLVLQRAQLTRAILLRMIKMAQMHDPKETGAHVNRVGSYAVEIYERWARKRGEDRQEIEKKKDILRMAAMLHDVGKVGISDLILKKPGRFTQDEFEIMKANTWLGAQLFGDKRSEFDDVSAQIALTHHENWDGSGYPGFVDVASGEEAAPPEGGEQGRKLREEEIPLFGRIVSLADVFDALSSKRVYKEAWGEEDVLNEIRKMSGTKFDPGVVEVFFEVLPIIRQIADRFPMEED